MSTNDFLDQVQESEQRGDISGLKDRVSALEERADRVDNEIRPLRERVEGVHYATPVQSSRDIGESSTKGPRSFSTFDAVVIAAVLGVIVVLLLIFVVPH